jgi:hypothetical protein
VKRKGGIARDRLKEAWSELASRRTEIRYEAVVIGRASSTERSPYPSRITAVNLAGVRGRLSDLPREICRVSARTGMAAKPFDRAAEVSRGRTRPDHRPKARTVPARG